jgi:hypothetical protein
MKIRKFSAQKDRKAVHQIWIESGWLKKDKTEVMDIFLRGSHSWVAEIHGQAESLASTAPPGGEEKGSGYPNHGEGGSGQCGEGRFCFGSRDV